LKFFNTDISFLSDDPSVLETGSITPLSGDQMTTAWRYAMKQTLAMLLQDIDDEAKRWLEKSQNGEDPLIGNTLPRWKTLPLWQQHETTYRLVHGITQARGERLVTASPLRADRQIWDDLYAQSRANPAEQQRLAQALGRVLANTELGTRMSQPLEKTIVSLMKQWVSQVWENNTPSDELSKFIGRALLDGLGIPTQNTFSEARARAWDQIQSFLIGWNLERPQRSGTTRQEIENQAVKLAQPNNATEALVQAAQAIQMLGVQHPDQVPATVIVLMDAFLQDFWALKMVFIPKGDESIRSLLTSVVERCQLEQFVSPHEEMEKRHEHKYPKSERPEKSWGRRL
jgi:hypothetical protein